MAHWIAATAEHKKRPLRINADNIAYITQDDKTGPTQIYFVGTGASTGKPDLLVLEPPDVLLARVEKGR